MAKPSIRHPTCLIIAIIVSLSIVTHGCASKGRQRRALSRVECDALIRLDNASVAVLEQASVRLIAPELEDQLDVLMERLDTAAGTEKKCRLHIINAPVFNAFAFSSGDIFVYTGLIDETESVDQLAAALGHELAHVIRQDTAKARLESLRLAKEGLVSSTLLTALVSGATAGAVSSAMGTVVIPDVWGSLAYNSLAIPITSALASSLAGKMPPIVVEQMVQFAFAGYRQEQEFAADELGMLYAKRAGYDPAAAISFLDKYRAMKERTQGK